MSAWSLIYEGYEPRREGLREMLCALGNGYFVTRGAAPDARADHVHYPGTYLAGGYDRLTTQIEGARVENEDLVNLPNWLPLTLRIDGDDWLKPGAVEYLDYRQELDLRQGVLLRHLRFRDAKGRITRWAECRFVSMVDQHAAGLAIEVTASNWSGQAHDPLRPRWQRHQQRRRPLPRPRKPASGDAGYPTPGRRHHPDFDHTRKRRNPVLRPVHRAGDPQVRAGLGAEQRRDMEGQHA